MANTTRICSVDGCEKSGRVRRGMCNKHYLAWRRQNMLPECSIEGCAKTVLARTWCKSHYYNWSNYGAPETRPPRRLPPQNFPRTIGCKVEGCDQQHSAQGFCKVHYMRNRYATKKGQIKARQLEYRERNREKMRLRTRKWNLDNPDKAKAMRTAQYAKNRKARLEYRKRYRMLNRDKVRAANNRRKAHQLQVAINDLTAPQWSDIKASWGGRCAYCGEIPNRLTMDHYIPISKGGNHTASNIVPACGSCNSRKNDGDAPPFYYELTT